MTTTSDPQTNDSSLVGRAAPTVRRIPVVVWLIVLMQSFLMLGVGVLYPAYQSPDEVAHIDYVIAHRHGEWLDKPGQRFIQTGVLQGYVTVPQMQTGRHLADTPPLVRSQRRSFDAMGTDPSPNTSLPNQMVQHPPLYYGLAAMYTYLIPDFLHQRFDVQIFWLRFLSMLLMIPVPIFLYLTGKRLIGSTSGALLMALLPFAIPSYLRVGASVNNDVLITVAGAGLLYLLARVLTGDLGRRTAALVGLAWGIMLLTKGFALVMPPIIVLSYLLASRGALWHRIKAAFLRAVVAGCVGMLVGGWWWIRNELVFGTIQPSGYGPAWPIERIYGPVRAHVTNSGFATKFINRLASRVFGSLGVIDEPRMNFRLLVALFIAMLVLLAIGLALGYPRALAPRLGALTMVLPVVLCLGLIAMGSRTVYWHTRQIAGMQVRYFLPFASALAAPVAVTLTMLARRAARWLPLAALALIAAFEVAVVIFVSERLYSASSAHGLLHRTTSGLRYAVGWAPWSPVVTGFFALAAGLLTVAVGVGLVKVAREDSGAVAREDSGASTADPQALPAV